MLTVLLTLAAATAIVGAAWDIVYRRIPNLLTYSALAAGFVLRVVWQGWRGAGIALLGGLLAGVAFLVFYLLHAMGAGDVKLMAAVGTLLGPGLALESVLATAIAGGVLALIWALARRSLKTTICNVGHLLRYHAVLGAQTHPTLNLSNPEAVRMPYGVAIAVGVGYSIVRAVI